jgi:hypothetical protein
VKVRDTNVTMKPRTNSDGTRTTTRPSSMVASQAKTWMPDGIVMTVLAALKKLSESRGSPVANMWCTHTPKEMIAIATRDSTTSGYAAIPRRQNVGSTAETMPSAGRTMMYTSG